jgi:creatinine amidohydrolase
MAIDIIFVANFIATMRPFILAETNWKHIKDAQIDLAILPWGATEAHNYHPHGWPGIRALK